MNKTELVAKMSEKASLTKKDADAALVAFQEAVTEELVAGGKVQLVGFLSLECADVPERECRNPKDGTTVTVPEHKKVKVKVGKSFKEAVKG